jgi:hypothetical protein
MITVTVEKLYPDGSGAPGIVEANGYKFAADWIGAPHLHLLSRRAPCKATIERAKAAYRREVERRAPEGWFQLNAKLYSQLEEGHV